ncbi:MAG: hypothetical protein V1796_01955, partial [Pseudomonadota bacterium]
TFTGALTTPALTTAAQAYDLDLLGNGTTITTATTFANTGTLTLGDAAGDILLFNGGVTALDPSGVTLNGQLRTSADAVSLGDALTPVTLAGGLSIIDTTNAGAVGSEAGNTITVDGAVNGTAINTQSLTLNAGTAGVIGFGSTVGTGTSLATLTVTNSGGATFTGAVTTGTSVVLTDTSDAANIIFTGALTTPTLTTAAQAYDLDLLGNGTTITTATTFANTGTLQLGDAAGDVLLFNGGVTATAPSGVTLNGQLRTSADAVSLGDADTPVTLAGGLSIIDTTNAGALGSEAGNSITVNGAVDGTVANTQSLTLNAGTGGNIFFSGAVGGVTRLGAITITNANDVTESAGITAASLVQAAGLGTTTFNGPVNANTVTGVQIATNNIVTGSGGTITTTAGSVGVVTLTNSGALVIGAPINADGNVTQNGSGSTTLNGDIVTTSDLVQFSQPVLLTGNRLIDTIAADSSGSGGTIRFLSTVDGAGNSLTLAAPVSGDIAFNQAASNLSALTVTSGRNFSTAATAPITVGSGGMSVTVDGTTTINSTITTSSSGGVTFVNGGLLTLNADINSDGAVTQNGAGAVTIDTDRTITTTADAVSFARDVTLARNSGTGLLTINTTSGNAAGANITFSAKLDGSTSGAEPVTLNAGTGGNILFTGVVGAAGAGSRLGAINITNANNVTESAGITAASLTQAAGQGTTTFNAAVNTNTVTGVNLTGNAQTVNAGVTTTGNGIVTFSNAGLLTLNADINSDGAVTQNGAGAVTINTDRTITTTADAVGFATNVTLAKTGGTGLLTINTTSGNAAGANVTFSNMLTGTTNSAENLIITAGSGGGVTFNGTVGTTRLGDVNISQARDVTVQSSFNAKTLTQSQGATGAPSTTPSAGITTINGAVDTTGNTRLATSGALNISGTASITAGAGSTVTLTTGNDMTLSGSVTAPAGATLNVIGSDRILTQNGGTLATTDSPIALIADEMMLTSVINSGSGAVTLKPNNTGDAIQLGVATAATNNAAATLELADSELNTVTTTGGLTVGASNHTGAITVAGALTPTTAQNGFTLLNNTGGIAINAPVTYAAGNGNLTLSANGGGAAAGALTSSGSALDANGTVAMNAATGVGTLASPMVLSHAAGIALTVTNTTSGGVFARADSGDLNVTSIGNSAAASGGINLNAGTNLNINGTVQNTIGDIQLVSGNDTAYTGAGGFGLSPASVAAGTLGAMNLNGQVIAGNGGGISIFSTGAVKQSAVAAAGLQSIPATGTDAQGPLKVRTFNNAVQVAVIELRNNLAGSGNSMGPITLEARLAGSINPPPYAESNIEYKSINGTSISGIGTAADFSLVAPSQTLDLAPGASLSGANVSLIATAGDVTVKSAITNAQINGGQSGGSLNLYATGNIVLNNPGGSSAGVVIGRDLGTLDDLGNREFEKFDHTLKLVATGDIRIYGTVEMIGDLALRANAGANEASGSGGVAGFGAGAGSVIVAGSAGNPVEVHAKNIVVGVRDASGNPLPVQNLIVDNSANTADSGQFIDTTLRADEKLDIYLNGDQGGAGSSGNIVITGGSATATSAGIVGTATKSSALAVVRGDVVSILGVKGGTQITPNPNTLNWSMEDPDKPIPETQTVNPLLPYTANSSNITLNGGTATSNTAAGGGALAAADALILGTSSKFIDIGGNIVMVGGTANSEDGGQTSAAAKIDPINLRINTGGYIKLVGGEGGGARAALVNSGDMEINIGGKIDYTYTDASGTHTVTDVGLLLVGGLGSGLYDRDNQPIKLYYDVSSQVLLLFPGVNGGAGGGSYFWQKDVSKASAFVQSLSPRGFDESLMAYIIFAANEETRTGRIRTGVSTMDDSSKPSCN